MKQTKPTARPAEEFKTLADDSSTSTSSTERFETLGENDPPKAAKTAKAKAEPSARPLPPRAPRIDHKMVKSKNKGKDFWVCSGCQYSTYNASSARQHAGER